MKKHITSIFFLCLLSVSQLIAQSHSIKRLGIEQGLSNNYVISIAQDKQGFLWFATEEGLNKFDGTRFMTYYKNDLSQSSQGITGNELNRVYADNKRPIIWIATQRDGLNAYNGRSFKTYSYNKKDAGSISNNVIWQIIEQSDSILWVSTDYGVNRWKRSTQQFTPYYLGTQNNPPKQEKSFLLDITSGKHIICYVKEQGLFCFDDRKQEFVSLKNDLPDDIRNFVIDSKDRIFFLTGHGQLLHYQLTVRNSCPELLKKSGTVPPFPIFIFPRTASSLTMTGR